jgi:hypothetical protein
LITCFIRYEIDPFKREAFETYARRWGEAIPRCGADLVGYFAPHERSSTVAYGVYHIPDLAEYYRARLAADSAGRENDEFARREQFIRRRGPNGARDEFHLAATAQNLRKLAKLVPTPAQRDTARKIEPMPRRSSNRLFQRNLFEAVIQAAKGKWLQWFENCLAAECRSSHLQPMARS